VPALATTAQIYPEITSWNSSVRLAHGVADFSHLEGF